MSECVFRGVLALDIDLPTSHSLFPCMQEVLRNAAQTNFHVVQENISSLKLTSLNPNRMLSSCTFESYDNKGFSSSPGGHDRARGFP